MARDAARDLGLDLTRSYVIGDRWRDVAVDNSCLSKDPRIQGTEPSHRQVFIGLPDGSDMDADTFERRLYIARKRRLVTWRMCYLRCPPSRPSRRMGFL
jgi:glutamate synthase domain-containing protein 1